MSKYKQKRKDSLEEDTSTTEITKLAEKVSNKQTESMTVAAKCPNSTEPSNPFRCPLRIILRSGFALYCT